jgi:hypothetical protein
MPVSLFSGIFCRVLKKGIISVTGSFADKQIIGLLLSVIREYLFTLAISV